MGPAGALRAPAGKLNVDNDYFFLGEHNLLAVEYIVTSIVTGGGSDLSGWAGFG